MSPSASGGILALALAAFAPPAGAAGDAARGARAFRQCMACHSTRPGEHLTGPSLSHVVGRKAASAGGYLRYSEALKRSGLTWDEATLDRWLAGPARLVPGTSMTFPGIEDARMRQDVVAYLKAGEGSPRPRTPDLKEAPPEGRVRSIRRCGDTYTVETADGKVEKIWEFNLRFKTDSSERGPAPGKPVVIGAGMQGDRASIVFASPAEISAAIVQSCAGAR